MKIQKAKLSDYIQIMKLLNLVKLDLHQKGIRQWTDGFDEIEVLTDIKYGRTYVGYINGEMKATFSIKTKQLDPIKQSLRQPYLYLYQLAIHPSEQGKGYGQKLIGNAMKISNENELELYLDCWSDNNKLRTFYSTAGFKYVDNILEDNLNLSIFKYEKANIRTK